MSRMVVLGSLVDILFIKKNQSLMMQQSQTLLLYPN